MPLFLASNAGVGFLKDTRTPMVGAKLCPELLKVLQGEVELRGWTPTTVTKGHFSELKRGLFMSRYSVRKHYTVLQARVQPLRKNSWDTNL